MTYGHIDLQNFEYLILYSHPDDPNTLHSWTLPKESFAINYQSMRRRGCIIHNVYRRQTPKQILDVITAS